MPKIVDKDVKREEIARAAMHVFAANGVVKTRMADIATAAGIGKGTIYEYFRSKEEIFEQAFVYVFQMTDRHLRQALSETSDPVEKIRLLVDSTLHDFLVNTGDFAAIMMEFWAEGIRNRDENIMQIIDLKGIYQKFRDLIASILQDGINKKIFRSVDVHSMSSVLIGALDGLMLQWIMDPALIDMKQVAAAAIDSFLNGLKAA